MNHRDNLLGIEINIFFQLSDVYLNHTTFLVNVLMSNGKYPFGMNLHFFIQKED